MARPTTSPQFATSDAAAVSNAGSFEMATGLESWHTLLHHCTGRCSGQNIKTSPDLTLNGGVEIPSTCVGHLDDLAPAASTTSCTGGSQVRPVQIHTHQAGQSLQCMHHHIFLLFWVRIPKPSHVVTCLLPEPYTLNPNPDLPRRWSSI